MKFMLSIESENDMEVEIADRVTGWSRLGYQCNAEGAPQPGSSISAEVVAKWASAPVLCSGVREVIVRWKGQVFEEKYSVYNRGDEGHLVRLLEGIIVNSLFPFGREPQGSLDELRRRIRL